jgi:hypothetical protein
VYIIVHSVHCIVNGNFYPLILSMNWYQYAQQTSVIPRLSPPVGVAVRCHRPLSAHAARPFLAAALWRLSAYRV